MRIVTGGGAARPGDPGAPCVETSTAATATATEAARRIALADREVDRRLRAECRMVVVREEHEEVVLARGQVRVLDHRCDRRRVLARDPERLREVAVRAGVLRVVELAAVHLEVEVAPAGLVALADVRGVEAEVRERDPEGD